MDEHADEQQQQQQQQEQQQRQRDEQQGHLEQQIQQQTQEVPLDSVEPQLHLHLDQQAQSPSQQLQQEQQQVAQQLPTEPSQPRLATLTASQVWELRMLSAHQQQQQRHQQQQAVLVQQQLQAAAVAAAAASSSSASTSTPADLSSVAATLAPVLSQPGLAPVATPLHEKMQNPQLAHLLASWPEQLRRYAKRPQARRRGSQELKEEERWYCPLKCGKWFKTTSTRYGAAPHSQADERTNELTQHPI
jgi:hypothetical protein